MISIVRVLYEKERKEKPPYSQISPEKHINEDERINKEKTIDDFKISGRIDEYKDTYYKIRHDKINTLREVIQEKNNKEKTDKDQNSESIRHKLNSSKVNQKISKVCIKRTPITFLNFILIFKLFYEISKIYLNNIVEQSSPEYEYINNNEKSIENRKNSNFFNNILILLYILPKLQK